MSIKIEINQKQLADQLNVHYLPAKIDGDGEANVEEYFDNYTVEENGHLVNSLRGFPLDGIEFQVPPGLIGVVFQETQESLDESSDRILRVTGCFEKFHYWNYDKIPSAADALRQSVQLVSVADELSKPVTAAEMEEEMKRHDKDTLKSAIKEEEL